MARGKGGGGFVHRVSSLFLPAHTVAPPALHRAQARRGSVPSDPSSRRRSGRPRDSLGSDRREIKRHRKYHAFFPTMMGLVFNTGASVIMKVDAYKFIVCYFTQSGNGFCFAYLGPFQILQNSGAFDIFEPHMHPGNHFWDMKKKGDDKLQVVSSHNHLVARCHVEN